MQWCSQWNTSSNMNLWFTGEILKMCKCMIWHVINCEPPYARGVIKIERDLLLGVIHFSRLMEYTREIWTISHAMAPMSLPFHGIWIKEQVGNIGSCPSVHSSYGCSSIRSSISHRCKKSPTSRCCQNCLAQIEDKLCCRDCSRILANGIQRIISCWELWC